VMITGTMGVVTVTGAKPEPNGSCPTIAPVYVFPSLPDVTVYVNVASELTESCGLIWLPIESRAGFTVE